MLDDEQREAARACSSGWRTPTRAGCSSGARVPLAELDLDGDGGTVRRR